MPICPFIAGDLQTGNIKFMVYTSDMDKSLIEMIKEWKESDFKTGLILHVGDNMKNIKRKKYQKFLRKWISLKIMMRHKTIKMIKTMKISQKTTMKIMIRSCYSARFCCKTGY